MKTLTFNKKFISYTNEDRIYLNYVFFLTRFLNDLKDLSELLHNQIMPGVNDEDYSLLLLMSCDKSFVKLHEAVTGKLYILIKEIKVKLILSIFL